MLLNLFGSQAELDDKPDLAQTLHHWAQTDDFHNPFAKEIDLRHFATTFFDYELFCGPIGLTEDE